MNSWKGFDEILLPNKKAFCSKLNLEDISIHVQKVCKDFEVKSLGDYYDLYVQNDTLLLRDVLENFRNKCIEIYDI